MRSRPQAQIVEALIAYGEEPITYEEAINVSDKNKWLEAMQVEYDSLIKNKTWSLTSLPNGRKAIKNKWVFKLKYNTHGEVERYKARLVAKGYSQKPGIDFKETFSSVARLESIRLILAIVAKFDMEMFHFDVKTAFLNGELLEEIYMEQPQGFEKDSTSVCKLKKSLYGLKQASKAWNDCFTKFIRNFGLKQLMKDSCIFVKVRDQRKTIEVEPILIIAIYVDDALACSNSKKLLTEVTNYLEEKFEITKMHPQCFVGLQITRDRERNILLINQQFYIEKKI